MLLRASQSGAWGVWECCRVVVQSVVFGLKGVRVFGIEKFRVLRVHTHAGFCCFGFYRFMGQGLVRGCKRFSNFQC